MDLPISQTCLAFIFFFLSVAQATDQNGQFLQKRFEGTTPASTFPPVELTTPAEVMDMFAKAFQGKTQCGQKYEVSNYLFLRQIGASYYLAGHPYTSESEEPGRWNGESVSAFLGAHAISTLLEEYCCGEDMIRDAGFSRCWCNYYAALGEPVHVDIKPGCQQCGAGERRHLVVIQGNPDGKAWEKSDDEPDRMMSLVQATYENILALMPQTFPILFKRTNFDAAKHCPHGSVSAEVIQELNHYDQGCFQYQKGFAELYDMYSEEFSRIGFSDSGEHMPKYANETFKMQQLCASDKFGFNNYKASESWYVNATEFLRKLDDAALEGDAPTPHKGTTKHPLCESTPWVRAYLYWAYGETSLFLGDGTTPGSPEYIAVPGARHGLLKLTDLPKGSSVKSVRDLMKLTNGSDAGPHASCLIRYDRRTYGWSVQAARRLTLPLI